MARMRINDSDERRQMMIDGTMRLIADEGMAEIRKNKIAEYSNCSGSLIYVYFDSMDKLIDEAIGEAVKMNNVPVLAVALANKRLDNSKLSEEQRAAIMTHLSEQ